MKVANAVVYFGTKVIDRILADPDATMRPVTRHRMLRLLKEFAAEAKSLDERRLEIVKSHAVQEEENFRFESDEARDKADAEWREVLEAEIEVKTLPLTVLVVDDIPFTNEDLMLFDECIHFE